MPSINLNEAKVCARAEEAKARARAKVMWRFSDLKIQGYVNDRATLRRMMARDSFPQPIITGPNSLAWVADEVIAWFEARPRGAAPQPIRSRAAQAA